MDPVLTEEDEHPHCYCGLPMQYVCAIGHESESSERYVDSELFYIGEGVLYFFLCRSCLQVTVMSQPVYLLLFWFLLWLQVVFMQPTQLVQDIS